MDELESGVDQGVWARSDTWLPEGGEGGTYRCESPFTGKLDTGRYRKQGKK